MKSNYQQQKNVLLLRLAKEKWIVNGELSGELEKLFEWINDEYKLKKKILNPKERKKDCE